MHTRPVGSSEPGHPPKVAVIGTGSLGREHARLYAELAQTREVEFVGVLDADVERARAIARQYQIPLLDSLNEAIEVSEALSIVTPTHTHFQLARDLLLQGKHLLVEKPMTDNAAQAAELVRLAHENKAILQVGHVERFNPVFQYLDTVAIDPRFIESHRLSPYTSRSTDVGVVLDLMIHDLDIVLAFVKAPVISVDAVGIPVLSASEDIANARIRFRNGCVANLTVSRISPERMRKIRVFSSGPPPSYISLDYRAQEGFIFRLAREEDARSSLLKKLFHGKDSTIISEFAGKKILREPVPIAKDEPLKLELRSFVECVRARHRPIVTGESAAQALELALEITRLIREGPDHSSPVPLVERASPAK